MWLQHEDEPQQFAQTQLATLRTHLSEGTSSTPWTPQLGKLCGHIRGASCNSDQHEYDDFGGSRRHLSRLPKLTGTTGSAAQYRSGHTDIM